MDQFFNLLPQALINSLIAGSIYSLIALGLNLIYGILGFVNFAHGDIAMVAAYFFFIGHLMFGWSISVSVLFMILGIVVVSLIIERLTFRPIRNAPTLIPLIVSVAVSFLLQNVIMFFFEAKSRSYASDIQGHSFFDGSLYFTDVHVWIVVMNMLLTVALFSFLKYSKTGKAIRAVADNKEVAQILGINVNQVIVVIFVIAAVLASVAGLLAAYDQNFNPLFGMHLGIKAFAAIILGGVGNIQGAVLGAFIIGLAENILILKIGPIEIPTAYKDTIAFFVLIGMLYFRPNGLLGARKEEIIRK